MATLKLKARLENLAPKKASRMLMRRLLSHLLNYYFQTIYYKEEN